MPNPEIYDSFIPIIEPTIEKVGFISEADEAKLDQLEVEVEYELDPTTTSESNPYIVGSNGETHVSLRYPSATATKVTAYVLLPTIDTDYVNGSFSASAIANGFHSDMEFFLDSGSNNPVSGINPLPSLVIFTKSTEGITTHNFATENRFPTRPAGVDNGFILGSMAHNTFEFYKNRSGINLGTWVITNGTLLTLTYPNHIFDGFGHQAEINSGGALKRYTLNETQFNKIDDAITNVISKTYEELESMVASGLLDVGQRYLLTDYYTKYSQQHTYMPKIGQYNMFDYDIVNDPNNVKEGIILTAISVSAFDATCYSNKYTGHTLEYDFFDNMIYIPMTNAVSNAATGIMLFYEDIYYKCIQSFTNEIHYTTEPNYFEPISASAAKRPGLITRRQDTIANIDIPFDYKQIVHPRYRPSYSNVNIWEISTESQQFSLYTDGPSGDIYICIKTNTGNALTDQNYFNIFYVYDFTHWFISGYSLHHNVTECGNNFYPNTMFSVDKTSYQEYYTFSFDTPLVDGSGNILDYRNIKILRNINTSYGFSDFCILGGWGSNFSIEYLSDGTFMYGLENTSIANFFNDILVYMSDTSVKRFHRSLGNAYIMNCALKNFTTNVFYGVNNTTSYFLEDITTTNDIQNCMFGHDFTNNSIFGVVDRCVFLQKFSDNFIKGYFFNNKIYNVNNFNEYGSNFISNTVSATLTKNNICSDVTNFTFNTNLTGYEFKKSPNNTLWKIIVNDAGTYEITTV